VGCDWRYQVITTVERPRHLPARVARLGSLTSKGALNMSEIHVPRRLGQDEDGVAAQAALTQYPQDCRPPGGIALMVVSGDVADNGASQGHDAVQAPVRAQPADAERLLALREAAASWLVGRGVRQWEPGEVTLQQVRDQVTAGEWFVARCGESVVGALRLLWQDEQMWGPQPPDAAYVHGLVVRPRSLGPRVGSRPAGLGLAAGPTSGSPPAAPGLQRGQRCPHGVLPPAGVRDGRPPRLRRTLVLGRAAEQAPRNLSSQVRQ